jgi:tetratricopeptide (TPR) repeat protein
LYDLQALCALQRKDFARAFRLEERAMRLDSATRDSIHRKPIFLRNLASAYVSRAAERINADSVASGIQDLRAALRLNPNSETAYINLGMVFGKQQKFDSALVYFQAAYRINPQSQVAQQYIYTIQQARREELEEQEAKQQQ